MIEISQVFIFAAGRGERMRPLTDSIPKPLVKIKNKSIIDYSIEKLNQISSVKKIIINGFYLAEQIAAHLASLNNPKIIFSYEKEKIETGGGLVFARDKIDFDQPLLLINGDILWQENTEISDLEMMKKAWNSISCDILLGLKKKEDFLGYVGNGDFNFDSKSGSLQKIPNSTMSHVFSGVQIINPKILNFAPEKCFSMSHFYNPTTSRNRFAKDIKGVELPGKYFHIGTIEAIKIADENLS